MDYTKLDNKVPSLEKAKEICKTYKRPLHNHVIMIGAVAPFVTKGGIILSEAARKTQQSDINARGLMIVNSPFKEVDETNYNAVYEGERVLYAPNSPAAFVTTVTTEDLVDGLELEEGKEVTSEMYKRYVVMCMSVHQLTCVVETEENK